MVQMEHELLSTRRQSSHRLACILGIYYGASRNTAHSLHKALIPALEHVHVSMQDAYQLHEFSSHNLLALSLHLLVI